MSVPAACPTQLGSAKDLDATPARLHRYARRGQLRKMRKLLVKGADPDVPNTAGQSPLFMAALLGHANLVEPLLRSGANPNLRCFDGSTAIHAAAFSCLTKLLSTLLDAGGDLRLHDNRGRSPEDWALAAGPDRNSQVLDFLWHCRSEMSQLLTHNETPMDPRSLRASSSARLLTPTSSVRRLFQLRFFHSPSSTSLAGSHSLGFGKLYRCGLRRLGVLGSTPIVGERELVRPDCEREVSYANGPFTVMNNRVWGSQRVTVRQLKQPSHTHCSKPQGTMDLLIAEQEHCSHLHHPNLLLLLSVCLSDNLEHVHLVYERVAIGSLYTILHTKRCEFPSFHSEQIVRLLYQVCEALLFLHSRGYIHRSVTSHSVQLVNMELAKLSNLEYMQERSDGMTCGNMSAAAIPHQLYNWLPPEIICGRVGTERSDIYSFCTVTQEAFTGSIPWASLDGLMVKEMLLSGRSLSLDTRVPSALQSMFQIGISLRHRDRTLNLQDIRFTLSKELQVSGPSIETAARRRVPSVNSQDRHPPRLQTNVTDAVDGFSPVRPYCQSKAYRDSTENEGMCYYEVDFSSSQSYYSTYSQYQSSEASTGLPAGTAPPGHQPDGRTENQTKVTPSPDTLMELEGSMCGAQGHMRTDLHSGRSQRNAGCELNSSECATDKTRPRSLSQVCEPGRERVRVYSVRHGKEIELESDSSLILESVSECTSQEGESDSPDRTSTSPRVGEEWMSSTFPSAPHGGGLSRRPQAPFRPCSGSIQESASLLEWANNSLQRMERSFINSIQTLEQFTAHDWEAAEQHQCQRVTNQHKDKAAGLSNMKPQLLQDVSDRSACGPGMAEQRTSGTTEFLSCSGTDPLEPGIIQGSAGAFTVCHPQEHHSIASSTGPDVGLESQLKT
ncbi:inactive serine/threonine-protein kinase TEX14-like [Scyliorhinus torazame]